MNEEELCAKGMDYLVSLIHRYIRFHEESNTKHSFEVILVQVQKPESIFNRDQINECFSYIFKVVKNLHYFLSKKIMCRVSVLNVAAATLSSSLFNLYFLIKQKPCSNNSFSFSKNIHVRKYSLYVVRCWYVWSCERWMSCMRRRKVSYWYE